MDVAELKLVDSREYDLVIRDMQGSSVKELEAACKKMASTPLTGNGKHEEGREAVAPQVQREILRIESSLDS